MSDFFQDGMLQVRRRRIALEAFFEKCSEGMFLFEKFYGSGVILYFQEQVLFGCFFEVPV
jgi:hypothetical protein